MGVIQRKTLFFGGINTKKEIFSMGVPGPAWQGGSVRENSATVTGDFPDQPAEHAYLRIDIPSTNALGRVTGIGIAPDSSIFACDIALAGQDGEIERHRISPGNPLIGDLSHHDFALVSLPNPIPTPQITNYTLAHDSSPTAFVSGADPFFRWPLRLEVWRDMINPVRQHVRAPLFAHGIVAVTNAGAKGMLVCVDGRRRIDLQLVSHNTNATVAVDSLESFKTIDPLTSPDLTYFDNTLTESVLINGAATQPLVSNTPVTFSFDGNPYTLIYVKVTSDTAPGAGKTAQIKVSAWDDY